jgi:MFS family permease
MGLWIAAPLYTIYFVKSLHADDGWLGLQGTVLSAATIIGYTIWRRLNRQWGESITLKRTIVCAGLYPILAGLIPDLNLILIVVALNGLLAPGINLSHFNTLLKVTPESNRPGYTALYMTIMNIGAFIGPLIGIALAGLIGVGPTLVLSGILSVIGSASFTFWPVRAYETSPVPGEVKLDRVL